MVPNTWAQTAHVVFPQSPLIFQTIRQRPVAPRLFNEDVLGITLHDGTIVFWYIDGMVVELATNGVKTLWYTKPSLSTAIKWGNEKPNSFYQFYADGSVVVKINESTLYWSRPFYAKPLEGQEFITSEAPQNIDENMEMDDGYVSPYDLDYDSP